MELTREEIVGMINDAIKLALVNKSDTIHNHDDLYHQKNIIYTRDETDNQIKTNIDKLNEKLKLIDDVYSKISEIENVKKELKFIIVFIKEFIVII